MTEFKHCEHVRRLVFPVRMTSAWQHGLFSEISPITIELVRIHFGKRFTALAASLN
jgi:hypothetical protein